MTHMGGLTNGPSKTIGTKFSSIVMGPKVLIYCKAKKVSNY